MLVMSRGALSAGQAETYYEEKYSRDDYYTEEHRVTGQWFEQGADSLGLSGEVARKIFARYYVANGRARSKFSSATPRDVPNGGQDGTRPSTPPSRSVFKRWRVETPN
jgi:hypothetical protein